MIYGRGRVSTETKLSNHEREFFQGRPALRKTLKGENDQLHGVKGTGKRGDVEPGSQNAPSRKRTKSLDARGRESE